MKVEVRFAKTGHSHLFTQQNTIKALMNSLKNQFKIQYFDQKLISKSGTIMKENDTLQSLGGLMQMTYVAQNNQNSRMSAIPSLFLFDNKSLLSNTHSKHQPKQSQSFDALKVRCKYLNQIKKNVYELKPLDNYQLTILTQQNQQLATFYKNIYQQYNNIDNLVSQFVTIKCCVEQVTQLCDNQRKSLKALDRCLNGLFDIGIKKKLSENGEKLQTLVKSYENGLENDFIKKNILKIVQDKKKILYNKFAGCKKKLKQFADFKQQISLQLKDDRKLFKDKFKNLDHSLKEIDEKSINMQKQLKLIMDQIKQKYTNFIESIKKFIQRKCSLGEIYQQINVQNQLQQIKIKKVLIKQFIQQQRLSYDKLYHQNKNNQFEVIEFYKNFTQIYQKTTSNEKQLKSFQKQINNLSKEIQIFSSPQYQENYKIIKDQLKRRIQFHKNVKETSLKLQSDIKLQNQKRKQYEKWVKNIKHIPQINQLDNTEVPILKIVYQNTTDQILQTLFIEPQEEILQQNIYHKMINLPSLNQNQILKSLETLNNQVHQILNKKPQTIKIKNMQILLQQSSKIYYDIYKSKVQIQQNKVKSFQKINKYQLKQIRNLTAEIQKLKKELKQFQSINSKQQENEILMKKCQQDFNQLQLLNQRLSVRNLELEEHISFLQKKIKDIEKQPKGNITNENAFLIENLNKQLNLNHQLSNQLQSLQHQKQYFENAFKDLKLILGDKQSQILRLQNQLIFLKSSFPLDSIITINQNKDQEKNELKAQIKFLEQKNQELQQQLNKIIYKQIEDHQVQTQTWDYNRLSNSRPSSYGKIQLFQIKQGQKCIFIPFGQSTYVGLCLGDNQCTNYLSRNNIAQANHIFLLDLKFLPKKAQQLLHQCSLIVILKVLRVKSSDQISWVQGQIQYALGFQDDDRYLKNYSNLLHNDVNNQL